MKNYMKAVLAVAFFLCVAQPATAAGKSVDVTLPSFPVTINTIEQDTTTAQYPFIVYNSITYVPMTYAKCQLLGLDSAWDATAGLRISKRGFETLGLYRESLVTAVNKKRLAARVADGKITVNGKSVDNTKETYPLLIFRDITYFPLTWRFAVSEFGWEYSFDNTGGLSIMADGRFRDNQTGLYYIKGDIFIHAAKAPFITPRTGPYSQNLTFSENGVSKSFGAMYDCYGYDEAGPYHWDIASAYFDYQDGWIFTTWGKWHMEQEKRILPARYKINVKTGEMVPVTK